MCQIPTLKCLRYTSGYMATVRTAKTAIGWAIGIAISVVPLVLWANGSQLADPTTAYGFLTMCAKICAFSGFAMYAWSLILGARLRPIERLYGGLDKMYIAHHIFGGTSIILIILHPLFLSLRTFTYAGGSLTNLWNPLSSLYMGAGILSLFLMLLTMYFVYVMKVKHQLFIQIHRLLGWAILPAMLHVFLSHGQISENPWLRRYMLALTILAVFAFLYHSVFGSILIQRYRYRVATVNQLGQGIAEIVLRRIWRPIIYAPGQFAFLRVKDPDVDHEGHPFAITSNKHDPYIRMVIKNLGDFTAKVGKIDIGSEADLEGPYGSFSYLNTKNRHQVWIAGGIGITPFLGMARNLPKKGGRYHIDLYYCTKTPEEAVFTYELKSTARKIKDFRVISVCEQRDGFLTSDSIKKQSGNLTDKAFFICGPPIMMKSLQQQLIDLGVKETAVNFEDFSF